MTKIKKKKTGFLTSLKNYFSFYWSAFSLFFLGIYALYILQNWTIALVCLVASLAGYITIYIRKAIGEKKLRPELFFKAPSFIISKSGKILRYNPEAKTFIDAFGRFFQDILQADNFDNSHLFTLLKHENTKKNQYLKSDNIIYVSRYYENETAFLISRYDQESYPSFFYNQKKHLGVGNKNFSDLKSDLQQWLDSDLELKKFIHKYGDSSLYEKSNIPLNPEQHVIFKDKHTQIETSFEIGIYPGPTSKSNASWQEKYKKIQSNNPKELVDNHSLFESIFQDSPSSIIICLKDGKILNYNHSFKALCEDNFLENFFDYFNANHKEQLQASMPDLAKKEFVFYINKQEKPVNISVKTLVNTPDKYIYYITDLSEEKSLEQKFNQIQKMQAIGQLAGGVAHDFNNLLTAILGHTEILLERFLPTDNAFSDLQQIEQNAHRAGKLVKQLLAFSRQQTLRPKLIHLSDVLPDINELLRRLLGENIEIKNSYGQNLKAIKMDEVQLEQVILNLAVNAKDAMDSKGQFIITSKNISQDQSLKEGFDIMPQGEYVALWCQDTGCGMDNKTIKKIFEPFFTTKQIGEGTGLGLSTVYGIIKQSEAFIFVDSIINKGTTFKIYFPAYEMPKQQESEIKENNTDISKDNKLGYAPHTKTILIAEDESSVRELIVNILTIRGYNILIADCGEEAIDIFKQDYKKIDLILSDVMMPGLDGPSWVKQALQIKKDIKAIFMSGYAEDSFREDPALTAHGIEAGFIAKPFTLKNLSATIAKSLND